MIPRRNKPAIACRARLAEAFLSGGSGWGARLVWLLLARARRRRKAALASPTVQGQPMTTRPLNAGERAAYRILVEALPRGYLRGMATSKGCKITS